MTQRPRPGPHAPGHRGVGHGREQHPALTDHTTIRAIQDLRDLGLPEEAGALLIARSDRGDRAAADVALMGTVCRGAGALEVAAAEDQAESEMLMQARRLVAPALERLGVALFEDVAVPRARLVELLDGVDGIAQEAGVTIACSGHAGDGNMHPVIVVPRDDPAAAERARSAFEAIMHLGLSLGGTITGEHGVGLLKRSALQHELGPLSATPQRHVKAVFDPAGILNPGKVFEEPADVVLGRKPPA